MFLTYDGISLGSCFRLMLSSLKSGRRCILLTDEERMKLYHVCKDTLLALELEQIKLDNAMFEYHYAMMRYNETVGIYINDIMLLLKDTAEHDK